MKPALGKVLYGALFTVFLPILLVIWAANTRAVVSLPAVHSLPCGLGAIGFGLLLMGLGMASLWRMGGGLPMNAFPPPRYVSSGVYRLFCHPIYVGFSFACIGVAIAAGSTSGLWLVSTTVRVINHGAYAAAGVFIGIWILDTLLGQNWDAIPIAIVMGGVVGAALWAQVIEGSPALLRPLGFYGGMLGASAAAVIAAVLSRTNAWLVLSALSVAAPWIQGIGRDVWCKVAVMDDPLQPMWAYGTSTLVLEFAESRPFATFPSMLRRFTLSFGMH